MTSKTHHTRYFDVVISDKTVTIRRTKERYDLQEDLFEACSATFEVLRPLRHLGLIIDLRGVVGRPEANFESKFARTRAELMNGHPRIAVIVETAVGRLQISRQIRNDGGPQIQRVFVDKNEALAFATGC
jgi:hypothetical protein